MVCWGWASDVHDVSELHSVAAIEASATSFAAIRSDGHVRAWGPAATGGDCRQVQSLLHNAPRM